VRPENVSLVPTGPGANRFECTVVGQRFQGDMREVELQLPHGGPVLRCRTRTPVLSTDRPVTIEIRPEHVEVLSPDDARS